MKKYFDKDKIIEIIHNLLKNLFLCILHFRYPNTSCEVLTCDVTQINDRLAGDDTYINKLYSFLGSKGPLNPLLASFVSKVMGLLIARKSEMVGE